MPKWAILSGSNRVIFGAVAMVAIVAIGSGFYFSKRAGQIPSDLKMDVDRTAATGQETKQVLDAEDDDASGGSETVALRENPDVSEVREAALAEPKAQVTPSIDEVRLEADGLAIIAGRAAPGSTVSVLVDGKENTEVTADSSGSFAAITVISNTPDAQELTIMQDDGNEQIASSDQVILAPKKDAPAPVEDVASNSDPDAQPSAGAEVVEESEPSSGAGETTTLAKASELEGDQPSETAVANVKAPSKVEGQSSAAEAIDVDESNAVALEEKAEGGSLAAEEVVQDLQSAKQQIDVSDHSETDTADLQDTAPDPVATEASEPQVTVLKSTSDGVEVMSTRKPQALENISLDTISYSDAGDVQLAGRAQSETEVVRVYVDNRPVADLEVDADGQWRGNLPAIDTGIYTLRVDEVDTAGDVTSRVETPFKREDPQVLADADDTSTVATQITVQTGNTLWAIARDRYGEGRLYVQVFEANKSSIRNPDLIYPGQIFDLPDE